MLVYLSLDFIWFSKITVFLEARKLFAPCNKWSLQTNIPTYIRTKCSLLLVYWWLHLPLLLSRRVFYIKTVICYLGITGQFPISSPTLQWLRFLKFICQRLIMKATGSCGRWQLRTGIAAVFSLRLVQKELHRQKNKEHEIASYINRLMLKFLHF